MGAVAPRLSVDDKRDRAERLRARLPAARDEVGPAVLAADRAVALPPPLDALVPRGLRRGSVVGVDGPAAPSLAMVLVAVVAGGAGWVAVVDGADLGLAAAGELGVDLGRCVLVDPPADRQAEALMVLVDAVDVVLVGAPRSRPIPPRVRARCRERGVVLVGIGGNGAGTGGAGLGPTDLALVTGDAAWVGPADGAGRLTARRVTMSATGWGVLAPGRSVPAWLPGPTGGLTPAEVPRPVTSGVTGTGVTGAGWEQVS